MDLGDVGNFLSGVTSDVTSVYKTINPTPPIVAPAGSKVLTTPSGLSVLTSPTTSQATISGVLLIGGILIFGIAIFALLFRK